MSNVPDEVVIYPCAWCSLEPKDGALWVLFCPCDEDEVNELFFNFKERLPCAHELKRMKKCVVARNFLDPTSDAGSWVNPDTQKIHNTFFKIEVSDGKPGGFCGCLHISIGHASQADIATNTIKIGCRFVPESANSLPCGVVNAWVNDVLVSIRALLNDAVPHELQHRRMLMEFMSGGNLTILNTTVDGDLNRLIPYMHLLLGVAIDMRDGKLRRERSGKRKPA